MLKLDDIHTYYGDSHILQGVTMEVPEGRVTALLGRNGMGKTTTIHSIIGFTPPAKGEILFNGVNIAGLPAYKIARAGIALVPQGRRLFRSLTVKENLMLGWNNKNLQGHGFNLEDIYRLFPVLKERASNRGEHISGGEQQMLAFARALMTNPRCILMDEPFEGLSPMIVKELGHKIKELKNSGITVLLVEQSIQTALKLADYVYIMNKGKIVYEGTPEQIRHDEHKIKGYML